MISSFTFDRLFNCSMVDLESLLMTITFLFPFFFSFVLNALRLSEIAKYTANISILWTPYLSFFLYGFKVLTLLLFWKWLCQEIYPDGDPSTSIAICILRNLIYRKLCQKYNHYLYSYHKSIIFIWSFSKVQLVY